MNWVKLFNRNRHWLEEQNIDPYTTSRTKSESPFRVWRQEEACAKNAAYHPLAKEALEGMGDFNIGDKFIATGAPGEGSKSLQYMLKRLVETSGNYWMELNVDNSKVIVISETCELSWRARTRICWPIRRKRSVVVQIRRGSVTKDA